MKIGIGIIDGDDVRVKYVSTLKSHEALFPAGYDYGFRVIGNTVFWWEFPENITDFMRQAADNYLDRQNQSRNRRHVSMLTQGSYKKAHGATARNFRRYSD